MAHKSIKMAGYEIKSFVEVLKLPPQREAFDCWINQLRSWDLALIKNIHIWTVIRGSNPGGDYIFRNSPDRPWGPPNPLHNEYLDSPEVKPA
jgi:hypothetical protein